MPLLAGLCHALPHRLQARFCVETGSIDLAVTAVNNSNRLHHGYTTLIFTT